MILIVLHYKYYFNFFSTEVKEFPFDQPLLPIFEKIGLKKGLSYVIRNHDLLYTSEFTVFDIYYVLPAYYLAH